MLVGSLATLEIKKEHELVYEDTWILENKLKILLKHDKNALPRFEFMELPHKTFLKNVPTPCMKSYQNSVKGIFIIDLV